MNHDKLRQQAEATLSNAGSSSEYIMADSVLALLDEIATLRAVLADVERVADAIRCPAWEIAHDALEALGDAS